MCTDETSETRDDLPSELPEASNESTNTDAPNRILNRRRFLTAAALGTAAAALLNKGSGGYLNLGPALALANDLSGNPCTAGDVEIIGTGLVQNEPCSCTPGGTFTAHVQFTVRNSTSTGRYCIALHLPGGFGVPAQDVILKDANGSSTAPGKSGGESFHDTVMFADILGFPCNSGGTLVCIGQQGVTTGKCAPNACTTIAWNTSPGAAGCTTADQKPPSGQCRHQGICILGYGAGLTCKSGCTPGCGGTAVLTATVSGGSPPYTYVLHANDGSPDQTFGPTSATSHDFTVTVTQNTTYTLTVTDSASCSRTATTSLSASPVAKPTLSKTGPDCDGNATITVTNCDNTLTYVWQDNGSVIAGASGCTLTKKFAVGSHSITVTASNSAGTCSATSDALAFSVNAPVAVSASAGTPDCAGTVTLTATASGGAGGYTFAWTIDGNPGGTGNPLTVTLAPGNHSITVTATDSSSCSATSAAVQVHINQPVSTSLGCGSTPDCQGNLTFTASATGGAGGYTFAWAIDGVPVAGNSSNTLAYTPNVDCNPHVVAVTATDSAGCVSGNTATRTITQVVCTTVSGCP
jgi:hypothetical protein